MDKRSFVFYFSFYDAICELSDEMQLHLYNAIMRYSFFGEEVELSAIERGYFKLIRPQLEANQKRYENGCKGGAPKGNQNAKKQPQSNSETTSIQPKDNQETTQNNQKQPNVNDNVNVNVNENANEYISAGQSSAAHTQTDRFIKPTLEEVEAYCRERGNEVDAQRFIDYYTANGWKVGKNPMRDWKAAVRTWEMRDKGRSDQRGKHGSSTYDCLKQIYNECQEEGDLYGEKNGSKAYN